MYPAVCVAAIVVAWALLALQVDPVPTWFYVFAWYPTLGLFDAVAARRSRERPALRRPRAALSLLVWSPPIWLLFEAANFRLRNWYYVFLPNHPVERWAGILISFATVVPAVILAERMLRTFGIGDAWRSAPLRMTRPRLTAVGALGVVTTMLALVRPTEAFALIWGCLWLLADPLVYVRRREWSLLGDIERGQWGRIGRLLLGGLLIGLLWEAYNGWARGKWIYTIPGIEHVKWFEMPPLGFLGFPFLALEAWAVYHLLCAVGVAESVEGTGHGTGPETALRPAPTSLTAPRLTIALPFAALFSTLTLLGMEKWTISSVTPLLRNLPGITSREVDALREAGTSTPFALTDAIPATLAQETGLARDRVARLRDVAILTTLRGIGTAHAGHLMGLGIGDPCALARADPDALWRALQPPERARPTAAEVRVWVRAGARQCRPPVAD